MHSTRTGVRVLQSDIDLKQYPIADSLQAGETLTLGDLHANPIKLVHLLIKHGLMEMEKADYEQLVDLYYNNLLPNTQQLMREIHSSLSKKAAKEEPQPAEESSRQQDDDADLEDFELIEKISLEDEFELISLDDSPKVSELESQFVLLDSDGHEVEKPVHAADMDAGTARKTFIDILNRAKVTPKPNKLRLLGDILSDRGANDDFMLLLVEKLSKSKQDFSILFSNHDAEFLFFFFKILKREDIDFDKLRPQDLPGTMHHSVKASLFALIESIKRKEVSIEDLIERVERHYFPYIQLMDYALMDNGYAGFFTHAPVKPELIKQTIVFLTSKEESPVIKHYAKRCFEDINTTKMLVDYCNRNFRYHVFSGQWTDWLMHTFQMGHYLAKKFADKPTELPIFNFVWGRAENLTDMSVFKRDYNCDELTRAMYLFCGHDYNPMIDMRRRSGEGESASDQSVICCIDSLCGKDTIAKAQHPYAITGEVPMKQPSSKPAATSEPDPDAVTSKLKMAG